MRDGGLFWLWMSWLDYVAQRASVFLSTFLLSFPLPSSLNTPFCQLSFLLTGRFPLGLCSQDMGGGLDTTVAHLFCPPSWPGTQGTCEKGQRLCHPFGN